MPNVKASATKAKVPTAIAIGLARMTPPYVRDDRIETRSPSCRGLARCSRKLSAFALTARCGTYTGTGINEPGGITVGPGGAMWFVNYGGNTIGRITTSGTVTIYPGTGINGPEGIAVGPDGALWFTNTLGSTIGRIHRR
jgi:streptogramin lyase